MTNRNGLLVGSLVVAGTLLVLMVAGGVLAQAGAWNPAAMWGRGSGMMPGMGGGMMSGGSGMMHDESMMNEHMSDSNHMNGPQMQQRHAQCHAQRNQTEE